MINKVTSDMVDKRFKDGSFYYLAIDENTVLCVWDYKPTENGNKWSIYETVSCVDPLNFSIDIGRDVGMERIKDKIWKMLGYELFLKQHFNFEFDWS